jgi:hypothetical protein
MLLGLVDLPFWLLFGLCVTIGLSNVVAGIAAAAVLGLVYLVWRRCQSSYRCDSCQRTLKYADVVNVGSPITKM